MTGQDPSNAANARLIRWLTCLMFFTFAMTTDAVGSVIPKIIDEFGLTLTAAGAFQYAGMAGIAAGALLLGFLADRIGRKRTIVLGLALYGASSLLVAVSHAFVAFVALLTIAGLGISVFKTGALALIGDVTATSTSHTRLMNTVEGFFAVGAIAGPAIVATLIAAGLSWKWLYVAAASICTALVILASRARYPRVEGPLERATLRQMVAIVKDPLALGFSALVVLYVAVESAVYVWMPTYLQSQREGVAWIAVYALTIFFVLRAVGRFVGAWFLGHLRWAAALTVFGFAILLCFAGSLVWDVGAAAWLLPLSGLFMSIMYPTLNSKGISCFPKTQHGAAAGVILFFTAAAAAFGPLAMAAVSDVYGSTRAGFVLATVFAFLLFAGLLANWLLDPAGPRLERSDDSGRGAAANPPTAAAPQGAPAAIPTLAE